MDYYIFACFLQIICLYSLQMLWKDVPLWFCVFCIVYLQFDISDDTRIVSVSINSIITIIFIIIIIIIIIINKIIWFFIWFFLKTLLIITKYLTSITNIQSLWHNNWFWGFISLEPPKSSVSHTIQFCLYFRPGCIEWSWLIFSCCGITCHT